MEWKCGGWVCVCVCVLIVTQNENCIFVCNIFSLLFIVANLITMGEADD